MTHEIFISCTIIAGKKLMKLTPLVRTTMEQVCIDRIKCQLSHLDARKNKKKT